MEKYRPAARVVAGVKHSAGFRVTGVRTMEGVGGVELVSDTESNYRVPHLKLM